jgi:hypothetical protein
MVISVQAKDARRCRTLHGHIDAGSCALLFFRQKMCVRPDAGPCASITSFQVKDECTSRCIDAGPYTVVIIFPGQR